MNLDQILITAKVAENKEEAKTIIAENYIGTYASLEDWAKEYLHKNCSVPNFVKEFIDYTKFAKTAQNNGDILVLTEDNKVFVFSMY